MVTDDVKRSCRMVIAVRTWSLNVQGCTGLWFVNELSLVFIVMSTALFLLLSKPCYAVLLNACASLGTEPKKAPYAITGVNLGEAHQVLFGLDQNSCLLSEAGFTGLTELIRIGDE